MLVSSIVLGVVARCDVLLAIGGFWVPFALLRVNESS